VSHSLRTAVVGAVAALAVAGCATTVRSASSHSYAAAPSPSTVSPAPAPPTAVRHAAGPTLPPRTHATRRTPAPVPSAKPPPAARSRYVFPIAGCASSYGHSHHDYPATDIFAGAGCSVVAPVTGRVDEVSYTDNWSPSTNLGADRGGISVSVIGVDGVRYYGSHLSSVAAGVRPGLSVAAGQLLGRVGNTGSARGLAPHLHFGISWPTPLRVWWVRRGEVYPWPYLDSWRSGGSLSPAAAVVALRARLGVVPPCTSYC